MKLERDSYNGLVGGVCSGVANFFGIGRGVVRILTALGLLSTFGTVFIVYLLMWMFLPDTDKYYQ